MDNLWPKDGVQYNINDWQKGRFQLENEELMAMFDLKTINNILGYSGNWASDGKKWTISATSGFGNNCGLAHFVFGGVRSKKEAEAIVWFALNICIYASYTCMLATPNVTAVEAGGQHFLDIPGAVCSTSRYAGKTRNWGGYQPMVYIFKTVPKFERTREEVMEWVAAETEKMKEAQKKYVEELKRAQEAMAARAAQQAEAARAMKEKAEKVAKKPLPSTGISGDTIIKVRLDYGRGPEIEINDDQYHEDEDG